MKMITDGINGHIKKPVDGTEIGDGGTTLCDGVNTHVSDGIDRTVIEYAI